MTALVVPNRARRHPMTVVTRARDLALYGYSHAQVARMLEADGVTVDPRSVARWTNTTLAGRIDQRQGRSNGQRSYKAAMKGIGTGRERPEFKLGRMRALREQAGLKDIQIARVMTFDYGEEMTRAMVAYALRHNRYPRSLR